MSDRGGTSKLTLGKHLAGASLAVCAIATLGLLAFLPSQSAASVELPFLDEHMPPLVLAFAGYPGCGTICPTSLAAMSEAWRGIDEAGRNRAALLFVNIERDAAEDVSSAYARAFHPDFRAWAVSADSAAGVYRALALRSFESREQAAAHSGFIYLFARDGADWRIERVYRRSPDAAELRRDLLAIIEAAAEEVA